MVRLLDAVDAVDQQNDREHDGTDAGNCANGKVGTWPFCMPHLGKLTLAYAFNYP